MAPPFRPWTDLHADLLIAIVDHLRTLRDYVSVRGVCTAWRSALPSASPCVLVLHDSPPHVSTSVEHLGFVLYNTRVHTRYPSRCSARSTSPCSGTTAAASPAPAEATSPSTTASTLPQTRLSL
ncbi:hypothetical protein ZWY2020_031306 [Hordeum vulgare]|nr:hypothetical protein ZWY2020_031306 [Hordeum vulgare]